MLKLHQIYFRNLLIPFVILFLVVGGIVYYGLKEIYINQTKEQLLSDIKFIALDINRTKDLDKLVKTVKKEIGLRVTIIKDDGEVLAESDKDKAKMDNHKYRPEIVKAREKGEGYSSRYSKTLKKELFYVAKKYKNNLGVYYIRVAKELKEIDNFIFKMGLKVFIVLILFFAVVFYTILKLSRSLEYEVDKISKFLLKLTKKKKEIYITSNFSKEFANITKLLTKVASILAKRDKQKAKYTAKLKKSNAQKDEIISAISHEFKNPITVINGYSQTLLEDKDINEAIREKFLQKIYSNGERLSNLINTLRLSLKLDSGKMKLTFEQCNVHEIVKESIENLKQIYQNREIIISGSKDVIIEGDRVLLGVAITNLIENALKYSEEKVEIKIDKDFLSIKDYGVGIEESELKNITKKFYRVSSNGWNNSLGLGLSIVSNILTLHNFSLEIESQKNDGSEFKIIFVK